MSSSNAAATTTYRSMIAIRPEAFSRTSEQLLCRAFDAIGVGVALVRLDARVVFANEIARRHLLAGDTYAHMDELRPHLEAVVYFGRASAVRWMCGDVVIDVRFRALVDTRDLVLVELRPHPVRGEDEGIVSLVRWLRLSRQDAHLLWLIWRGLRNREIGEELGVPDGTVKSRICRLYRRIGVTDRVSAVWLAGELLTP